MTVQKSSPILWTAVAVTALLSGCVGDKTGTAVYSGEVFHATGMYSHQYPYPSVATCEAARRALLSQGYVVADIKADIVNGQKSFQPTSDTHVEIAFHVVCVSDDAKGNTSTAFINALQDRYAIKKTPSSASLGVGAVGAVSLPFGSSDDSLVKIASETIPPGPIYDQFFSLTGDYLKKIGADFGPEPKHDAGSVQVSKPASVVQKPMPPVEAAKTGEEGKPPEANAIDKAATGEPVTGGAAPGPAPVAHPGAPATPPADEAPIPSASSPSPAAVSPPVEPQTESTDKTSSSPARPLRPSSSMIES